MSILDTTIFRPELPLDRFKFSFLLRLDLCAHLDLPAFLNVIFFSIKCKQAQACRVVNRLGLFVQTMVFNTKFKLFMMQ